MNWDMDGNRQTAEPSGPKIVHVRHGSGTPPILQHGWLEFWSVFRKTIPVLAENFVVLVDGFIRRE